jgi:uncharacterized membrane protein YbhN (UPF0104 family)/tRNA A-37 threonylcarbamoyl transferase component Bud32
MRGRDGAVMRRNRGIGPRGFRFFASPIDEPRARRASDVLVAAATVAGLLLSGWVAAPPVSFETALGDLLAAVPGFLDGLWQLVGDLLVLWAVVLVLVALARHRLSLVRDQVLAALLALIIAVVTSRAVEGSWPEVWRSLGESGPPPLFPALRVAAVGAGILVASPYLSRPARRVSQWIVAGGAASAAVLGATSPSGAVAGVLVAVLAAAVVHLVVGSCGGRPGVAEVRAALDELGVRTLSVGVVDRQLAGAFLVHSVDGDGQALAVKVYGRDAYDTQLLARLWRTTWYRQEGPAPTLSRLQQAEHEAFLTLLARQAGVPTQEVVTAGITAEDDALLVLRLHGEPLADLQAEDVSDAMLHGLWRAIEALHRGGIVHGQIDPRHVVVEDGTATLINLSAATVTPTEDQRRTDLAQAVVTSVVVVGAERGLAVARDALGADGLARVLPYLQMPALSRGLRPQVRRAGVDLDHLREQASALAGVPPTELAQLRRVTWGTLLQTGLLMVAVGGLISGLADLDIEDITAELRDATWWLIVLAALLVQVPRFAQAISTLGACPRPLPLGPVYALQLAISYVNLAIPSTAARIAVNVRFFQRQGVPPGSAMAVGAIDGFSGFVVQMLLLVSLLVFSNVSLDLQLDPATSGGPGRLLVALAVLVVVAAAVVLAVRPWRHAVLDKATELGGEAWAVLRGLRSARRWTMLLGGNLAAEVLFAASLGAFARALGYDVGLGELLLINVSVALLAGLMPVPGGIGVAEGALTVGLTAAGLPEPAAFAVAIVYRLASFYLPPIWGWFAFRWLQANKYL